MFSQTLVSFRFLSLRYHILFALCVALALNSYDASAESKNENLGQKDGRAERMAAVRGSFGTYAGTKEKQGRVDREQLLHELVDSHVRTYNWLIWTRDTDWDDLKLFLPAARDQGINVWVTLVPPSESPPRSKYYSEPFRLDYERWAIEIAKLSLRDPNLVAWSIDDFTHNLQFYTPEMVAKMVGAAREINPRVAFVPCSYFPRITEALFEGYRDTMDGILFPYRSESTTAGLTDSTLVNEEVKRIREMAGPDFPIIVDVYASAHSRLGASTPEYVCDVMERARKSADGVLIYCHQKPETEKYELIKRLFKEWSTE